MTLKKHVKRGTGYQSPDVKERSRTKKHVIISKKERNYGHVTPDSSESLTACHADHPSNKVGGMGRTKYRKPGY